MSADIPQLVEGPLTADDIEILEQTSIFKGKASGGKRKVSARLLTPSDSDTYNSVSSSSSDSSSASLRFQGVMNPSLDQDFELPTDQESVAALQYMGFTQAAAQEIHQSWEARSNEEIEYPYTFLEHVVGRFKYENQRDLSHADFMTKLGFNQEFQDAILSPEFISILETETLKFWIQDTTTSRYHTIGCLQQRCRNIALRNRRGKGPQKKKSRPSLPANFTAHGEGQAGPSNIPAQEPMESLSLSALAESLDFPRAHVRIGAPAAALDDHYTLYKGRRAHIDDIQPLVEHDGSIQLTCLETYPGGDFNSRIMATYWTPEIETADFYRRYAVRRDALAETCIISIQVPKTFVASLQKESLWYSADWKEYVWFCRKRSPNTPIKFKAFQNAALMEGHICCKMQNIIARITPEAVQTTITEDHCVYYERPGSNGQMAKSTQWVFKDNETISQLASMLRGKIHIEIFPSSALKGQ